MKKAKLKLEDLQVKSFVTSLERTQKQTIDGGSNSGCDTASATAGSIVGSAATASASIISAQASAASAVVTPATSYVVSAAGSFILTKEFEVIYNYNCACVTFIWECWSSQALK